MGRHVGYYTAQLISMSAGKTNRAAKATGGDVSRAKKTTKAKKTTRSVRKEVEKILRKRKFNSDELLAFFDENAGAINAVDALGG